MSLVVGTTGKHIPYGALAIASYTGGAEIVYDEEVTGVSLNLDGFKIDTEEEIVHALAKAGGLSEDSAKVCLNDLLISSI